MTLRALKRLGRATTGQIKSLVANRVPKTRVSRTNVKGAQRLICGLYQSRSSSYYGDGCEYNVR